MPACGPGDSVDPRGPDFRFGRGREAYDQGAADLPHTPFDLSGPTCPASAGVIRVQQNQNVRLHLPLVDRNGRVIPLSSLLDGVGSSSGSFEAGPIVFPTSVLVSNYVHRFVPLSAVPAGEANCAPPYYGPTLGEMNPDGPYPGFVHVVEEEDVEAAGWLPADSEVFAGVEVPAGAKFGYNVQQDVDLAAVWPAEEGSFVRLLVNGMDESEGLARVTADGIWWMSAAYGRAPWSPNHTQPCGDAPAHPLASFPIRMVAHVYRNVRYLADTDESEEVPEIAELGFRFVAKHQVGGSRAILAKDAQLIDLERAVFEVVLAGSDLSLPGLFVSHLTLLRDGEVRYATPFWLEVSPVSTERSSSPLTISEIRLRMRDVCPDANDVLQDFEYTDNEIALAIRDPVDEFNATRPPVTAYTTSSFPGKWRYQWARASLAVLMKMASRKYLRDHLPYNAGGVSIDTKNKFKEYNAFADELHGEWVNFIYEQKARMNASRAYGRLRSGYSHL